MQHSPDLAIGQRQLELGEHRSRQLAQLDRLGSERDVGIDAAQVEQIGRQAAETARLRPGALEQVLGVRQVGLLVEQPLGKQLEHPIERGQRRAQLVRGGRNERSPRLLLVAQPALHDRERARQVADLVARAIDRELGARAGDRDPQRRLAQQLQTADELGGQRDGKDQGQEQPCRGRDLERVTHGRDRVRDLVDRLVYGQDRVVRHRQRNHRAHVLVAVDRRQAVEGLPLAKRAGGVAGGIRGELGGSRRRRRSAGRHHLAGIRRIDVADHDHLGRAEIVVKLVDCRAQPRLLGVGLAGRVRDIVVVELGRNRVGNGREFRDLPARLLVGLGNRVLEGQPRGVSQRCLEPRQESDARHQQGRDRRHEDHPHDLTAQAKSAPAQPHEHQRRLPSTSRIYGARRR